MFTPLPLSMSNLEAAVRLLDDVALQPPPPMMDIGRRLRLVYSKSRASGYVELSRSELRKLPFAYWVDTEPALSTTDPELVRQYWETYLPEAIQSSPRRAKRWLSPLFYTYCEHFTQRDYEFEAFAKRLEKAVQLADGLFAEKLRGLHAVHRFFDPSNAPGKLSNLFFMSQSKSVDQLLEDHLLWPGFVSSGLGLAIFKSALNLPGERMRESQTVMRLIDWSRKCPAPVVKTDLRVAFADGLLRHWVGRKPADSLRNTLVDFFLKNYGDPRFEGHRHYQWGGVSQQALGVVLNWLTGDTLRGFMKLLQRTADDIWYHRQKFWMAYYEHGHIDEAWIALGDNASFEARRLKMDEKGMGSGSLDGGATSNQSVLLMKIGGLVFTEWSHNGSLRAYSEGSPDAPRLYQSTYHGADLRAAASMDFHDGMNMRSELTHAHSDKGSWQRKARDFIRRHTGTYLSDVEIV